MARRRGLLSKFHRAFLLQAALISIAAILSVYFAKIMINEVLIKNAIKQEADFFWSKYQNNPQFPLPSTLNLTGFFDPKLLPLTHRNPLPDTPGFTEYHYPEKNYVLFISKNRGKTLYLLYNRGQVDHLVLLYGLIPLALVLIILYLALWLTYRISRRTISPIIQLAEKLDKIDFSGNDFSSLQIDEMSISNDDDVQILADAIENMGQRLELFTQRERTFTRDASHELRSPLTVINIAADMIMSGQQLTESGVKSVDRIKRAITDMEELTEAFLLLARETDQSLTQQSVSINEVVRDEIERSELLKKNKDLKINLYEEANLATQTSEKVVSVLIGNLIRNAILYTDRGNVTITIGKQCVEIADSGKGIDQKQVEQVFQPFYRANARIHGHGVGLTIVKRLSDRFNWPIEIDSEVGKGTRVKVCFQKS